MVIQIICCDGDTAYEYIADNDVKDNDNEEDNGDNDDDDDVIKYDIRRYYIVWLKYVWGFLFKVASEMHNLLYELESRHNTIYASTLYNIRN